MEASALRAPALARRPLTTPLLRLRSDEQLVALFRAGSEEAFSAMHDRYRQRLFAYVRQMLAAGPRADAEDVLQDVFVRAYGALRADTRAVQLRAWLYRVAHNRCIDHLRRPTPPAAEVFQLNRGPLQDPIELAQRREDLRRLVGDVGRLPAQQRSALLMREIDGLAYTDIAAALEVTVPAVKSLLVRARLGLVEAIEARELDCAVVREDLVSAYDRRVKASGRARRHLRECDGCREFRGALRDVRRSFASLSPVAGFAPLAALAKAAGVGGGAAGAGGATAGTVTACKLAVVVCGAALATGTVVEVRHVTRDKPAPAAAAATERAPDRMAVSAPAVSAAPRTESVALTPRHRRSAQPVAPAEHRGSGAVERIAVVAPAAPVQEPAPAPPVERSEPADPHTPAAHGTGGSAAPVAEAVIEPVVTEVPQVAVTPVATQAPVDPAASATPPPGGPPPEH